MSIKKYNIEIPKQDYLLISISINKEGQATQLDVNDLIFMTVKEMASNEEYIFQKSLGNGISYNTETGKYEIQINSEDTKELKMGNIYGYDITIYYNGNKPKQKVIGTFKIGTKFTLNEVI